MSNASPNRDAQTFAIIGAAMEVHRILGHGYLESYGGLFYPQSVE